LFALTQKNRLIKLLIGLGHERIAVITGPKKVSTAVDRVKGYRQALVDAGLKENELIYYGSFTQQSGYDFTKQAMLQSPRPTAIFAANNFILLGVVKALRELQLKVPEDISVVGFDDFPESMLVKPFFTAVLQPAYEMGRLAAELLLKRISGELSGECQKIILPTEIIERESSGPKKETS
jgi:DNA-binding LacI/PurR family transcriptional regulator